MSQESHQKVHEFLKKHPMGVLSTVSSDGKPWGAAIYYVAEDDFSVYFVTRVETSKYQNLEAHPDVALTIADPESQTTVQMSGTVSQVPFEDYTDVMFHKLAAIHPKDDDTWAPPLHKVRAGNYMPLKLTPNHLQYANYGERKSDLHADYIEQII